MSTKDFTANVISASKVVPDGNFKDSKASGIWDINEALDLIKGGNWPNAANLSPSAFVDALFQTHLYTGTQQVQNINNGLDLSSKGGLVWLKTRSGTTAFGANMIFDTERGAQRILRSHETGGDGAANNTLTSFNTNGFSLGISSDGNKSGDSHVSWSFRKQPKFFDIVTWTGNGASSRSIAHNLGSVPGMIMVKITSEFGSWAVYHRGNTASPETDYLQLNTTASTSDEDDYWADTAPTSTHFTVGSDGDVNQNAATYVAYLFAHNNNDGGFGEPGDQDIIKCGTCSGESGSNRTINLGFEPQWIMTKSVGSGDWRIMDTMRGLLASGTSVSLEANDSGAEGSDDTLHITPTGFYVNGLPGSGDYIFIAIRRGGMQTPTTASDVFDVEIGGSSVADDALATTTGFPVDMFMHHDNYSSGGETFVVDRLRGRSTQVRTQVTNAEGTYSTNNPSLDSNSGLINRAGSTKNLSGGVYWQWRRARGYFDVVAYTGNGTTGTTINHNLGVVPEMMWIRNRAASNLHAYHKGLNGGTNPENYALRLNNAGGQIDTNAVFNDTAPTASVFSTGSAMSTDGDNYIAYLFATAAGVSKVGSFTQNGATNVDCGFTGDTPSFIFFKRYDITGNDVTNQFVFDSARGIVAGNDKSLNLNNTDAEVTNADMVDPYSGGFATTSSVENGDYIFYAIAATS